MTLNLFLGFNVFVVCSESPVKESYFLWFDDLCAE